MEMKRVNAVAVIASLAVLFIATGCARDAGVGPLVSESRSVPVGDAAAARVRLDFRSGTFALTGGAQSLMEADFAYNLPRWKPEVAYRVADGEGALQVQQPAGPTSITGAMKNRWDLRLNSAIPVDLDAHLGMGTGTLALGNLTLTGLRVEMGIGTATLDLTGAWARSLDARVQGGTGTLILRLPTDIGVRVVASNGLGAVSASGLRQVDGAYVNDAYGFAPVTLALRVELGLGSVVLQG